MYVSISSVWKIFDKQTKKVKRQCRPLFAEKKSYVHTEIGWVWDFIRIGFLQVDRYFPFNSLIMLSSLNLFFISSTKRRLSHLNRLLWLFPETRLCFVRFYSTNLVIYICSHSIWCIQGKTNYYKYFRLNCLLSTFTFERALALRFFFCVLCLDNNEMHFTFVVFILFFFISNESRLLTCAIFFRNQVHLSNLTFVPTRSNTGWTM